MKSKKNKNDIFIKNLKNDLIKKNLIYFIPFSQAQDIVLNLII